MASSSGWRLCKAPICWSRSGRLASLPYTGTITARLIPSKARLVPVPLSNPSSAQPNLFIVGFAKCGTTALHEYLSTHPNVHPSFPKEPHFFIEPEWRKSPARTEAEYLRFFAGAPEDARVFLDSSAVHIYLPQALRRIREFNP